MAIRRSVFRGERSEILRKDLDAAILAVRVQAGQLIRAEPDAFVCLRIDASNGNGGFTGNHAGSHGFQRAGGIDPALYPYNLFLPHLGIRRDDIAVINQNGTDLRFCATGFRRWFDEKTLIAGRK